MQRSCARTAIAGTTCVMLTVALPARAQSFHAGAGVALDIQQFPGNRSENRLDDHAAGWLLLGGVTLFSHVLLRVEDVHGGRMLNTQVFTVDVDGRAVTIHSGFEHTTRSTAALAGFTHPLSTRLHLTYLAGISFTRVRRTFTTSAPALILVPPSASHSSTT